MHYCFYSNIRLHCYFSHPPYIDNSELPDSGVFRNLHMVGVGTTVQVFEWGGEAIVKLQVLKGLKEEVGTSAGGEGGENKYSFIPSIKAALLKSVTDN